ncbi:MAG: hypothetical protein M1839_000910, partial [Geoglossum umbratile]
MIATPTTGPTTAPAIQAQFFEGVPVGEGEMVGLDEVPSVLGAEVVVAGTLRYMVQALHSTAQNTFNTDDPAMAGVRLYTVM